MKRYFLKSLLCYAIVLIMPHESWAVPVGEEIMRKVAERPKGNNAITQLEMVLVESNGHQRSRKMKIFSRENMEKKQRILVFQEPPNIANTALLVEDYKEDDSKDNQWIYLPALHKSKRITSESSGNSFMGSDFSYSDLITRKHENFSYNFLKESEVATVPVWIVEAIPRNKNSMKECGYSKALFLVRQDNHVVIRSVLWVYGKSSLKYIDVKKLEKIDGTWVPMEIHAKTMENKKVLHQTVLRVESISFNNQFSDDLFSVQRLEQGY